MLRFFQLLCLRSLIVILGNCHYFQDIFYSRKNFERPELQLKPYRSFKEVIKSWKICWQLQVIRKLIMANVWTKINLILLGNENDSCYRKLQLWIRCLPTAMPSVWDPSISELRFVEYYFWMRIIKVNSFNIIFEWESCKYFQFNMFQRRIVKVHKS